MGAFDVELRALGISTYAANEPEPPILPAVLARRAFVEQLHVARQPCPGCCHEQRCLNTWCPAHPRQGN